MGIIRKISFVFGLIFMIFLNGCEYKIDDIYFREISKDVAPPDLTVNLNLTSDTIYVYSYAKLKFQLKITNKTVYAVKFFVNNTEITDVAKGNDGNYSFLRDMALVQMMKVRVEIYTSTETGSIADKLQNEAFILKSKEWTLIYTPDKPVLTSEIVNGRLKISWTPVKNHSNGKYYISYNYMSSNSVLLDSTYNTSYIDSSYTGGLKYFSISYNDNGISGYGVTNFVNYPYPKVFINNRDSFVISWEKCKFYNSISGYRLKVNDLVLELGRSDTSYVYKKGLFAKWVYAQVGILLKNYGNDNSAYLNFGDVAGYYQLSFVPYGFNYFYPLNGNYLYSQIYINSVRFLQRFSIGSKAMACSAPIASNNFKISPNDKYILSIESDNFKLFDPNGLGLIKTVALANISSSCINVTDLGTCTYFDYVKRNIVVYDLINNTLIDTIHPSQFVYQLKISADGSYLFISEINTLYRIGNQSHTKIWSGSNTSVQFNYYEFFPDNSNQMVLYDGDTFFIKRCEDFSTINSFTLNKNKLINIDFKKKKILTFNNSVFYVYSLSDGKLLTTIPSYLTFDIGSFLMDDYLFSTSCQLNLNNL